MTEEQIFKLAYKLGFKYEKEMHGCAQSTLNVVMDLFGFDENIFKAASSCSAGLANGGLGTCGGMLGSILAIGYFFGRDFEHRNMSGKLFKDRELTNKIRKKYRDTYGGETCREVQKAVFGRSYDLTKEEDKTAFEKDGAHEDKCTHTVGVAAQWIVKMLIDENVPLKEEFKISAD